MEIVMKVDGKSYHLGIRCFIVIREYATFGTRKTYESDDPFRWVRVHQSNVTEVDKLCQAIGGSYVFDGEFYDVLARRVYTNMITEQIAEHDVHGASVLRGYQSEVRGLYTPARRRQYDAIRERMVNPLKQAHRVFEHYPHLRALDTVAEISLVKTFGAFSCGGAAFDKFGVDNTSQ